MRVLQKVVARARLTVLFLSVAAAHGIGAQERNVLFQHGINSGPDTWLSTSLNLEQIFNLRAQRIDTRAAATYEDQADTLLARLWPNSGPGRPFYVGHSNGGVVGRTAAMRSGSTVLWDALITVGSPHTGAPAAGTLRDPAEVVWLSYRLSLMAAPIIFYGGLSHDLSFTETALLTVQTYTLLELGLNIFAPGFNQSVALLDEMKPTSTFMAALNGGANLAAEQSKIATQVSIVSRFVSPDFLFMKTLLPSPWWQVGASAQVYIAGYDLDRYFYYVDFAGDDPDEPWWDVQEKRSHAYMWLDAFWAWALWDQDWCMAIGAMESEGCGGSDGVVPAKHQVAPGSDRTLDVLNVGHLYETRSTEVRNALVQLFTSGASTQISLRTGPPPPANGGLSVLISGPLTVGIGTADSWSVAISGASGEVALLWSVNGETVSGATGQVFSFTNLGTDFDLQVAAVDAAGQSATASLHVHPSACAPYDCQARTK